MEEFARQDRQHLPAEDNQHNNLLEFASRRPDSWHGHGKLDGELNGQEPKSISVKGKRNASDFFFLLVLLEVIEECRKMYFNHYIFYGM